MPDETITPSSDGASLIPPPTEPPTPPSTETPSTSPKVTADKPADVPPVVAPVETPTTTPPIVTPAPSTSAKATVDVPPPPESRPAPSNEGVRSLLSKALARIQFRKRAKLEKIMDLTKKQGQITNDQVEKLLRVSDATASRYLAELVKSGQLRRVGVTGRGARYTPGQ